jgi:Ricin-type beta-trefoil lectin domain-like
MGGGPPRSVSCHELTTWLGNINNSDSAVDFTHVNGPTAGTYTVNVRYDDGTGAASTLSVSENGGTATILSYPATVDWNRYGWAQFSATLNAGNNTISFTYATSYAELDAIDVYQSGAASYCEFKLVNRNSSLDLEIPSASTASGTQADQWGDTDNPTQVWRITPTSSGTSYRLTNLNSGKRLDITGASTANGAASVQEPSSGATSQDWTFTATDSGYGYVTNLNSGLLLEIYQNSTANGAVADQWSSTGYNCQQWLLTKQSIQQSFHKAHPAPQARRRTVVASSCPSTTTFRRRSASDHVAELAHLSDMLMRLGSLRVTVRSGRRASPAGCVSAVQRGFDGWSKSQ